MASIAMTQATVERFAAELADREAIRECLYRYCRGIDRCDEALLRACYWDDSTDDHGVFKGSGQDFVTWALTFLPTMDQTQHLVGNILIDIEGAMAHSEAYYRAYHRMVREDGSRYDFLTSGRLIDRLERRDGHWRVAARCVVRDWFREYPDSADRDKGAWSVRGGARMPDDPSYALLAGAERCAGSGAEL